VNAAIFFHAGLLGYTVAAALFLAFLVVPTEGRARWGYRSLLAGFLFHAGAVGLRVIEYAQGGGFRLGEGLSYVAFLVVGIYLLFGRFYRIPTVGAFVAPLMVGALLAYHVVPGAQSVGRGPVEGMLLPFHIGVAVGGLALFSLGFVVALMYLLLERELKAKRLGAMFRKLPPLGLLDLLNYQLVLLGFLLLTFTIGTGAFFSVGENGFFFSLRSKEGFALVAWLLTFVVVLLRQTVGWRGKRVAWATMVGFLLLSFAFVGIFVGEGA